MGGRARGAVPVVEERCGEDPGVRGAGVCWGGGGNCLEVYSSRRVLYH